MATVGSSVIPSIPRQDFTDEELDEALARVRDRMIEGRDKFKGEWCISDLRNHAGEELDDFIAYCLLMMFRFRRVVPQFEHIPE